MRPLILVSNDDGYFSPGLIALKRALEAYGEVIVVAPLTEQSSQSHALSLHKPLRLNQVESNVYSLDGTPADCIYVALHSKKKVLPRWPDLMVSGINLGLNLGQDVFYSGTVAAAREASFSGIPSLAASGELGLDLNLGAALSASVAVKLLHASPGRATLLNLNIPKNWNQKIKYARLGKRHYEEGVTVRSDPRGKEYLWIGSHGVVHKPDPGSDTEYFDAGFATLTSLRLDLNDDDNASLASEFAI